MPKQPGWLGLKEYGDAVLRSFVVPFGAVFIERCLNTGVFKDSDVPYWWAITVVSFLLGRMLGGLVPVRSQQGPYRRRARHFLLSFLALTALVVGMGYVRKLQGLVILRFFTGLVASLMWSQEEANWNQSAGGRGAAAQEKGGVLLSPATCLGCLVGGVIGGFFFPTGTRVVVQPRPSLLPSVLASLAITLPALVALTMALGKRRPMHQRHARSKPAASNTPTPPRHHHMASTLSSSSSRSGDGGSFSPMRGGYGGGSADVESGGGMGQQSSIPVNFLRSCNNDRARAWARYQKTLEWRRANRVDSILTRPHPHFDVIKRYYPHYIHCRSLADELVIYEFPGRMDISKLKASGVSPVEMGQHYAFFMEFLFAHLDPREEARIMTVLDIGGISLSMLSSDVLEVLRTTSEIMQSHYPERVVRIVVVNVPFFLGSAWKVIASVLPKSVQDRIELSSDAPKDLRKYISPANLPQAYGGENRQDFGHSPEETELRRVVDRANGSTSQGGGGGALSSSSSQAPAPRAYIGASPPPFTVRPTRVATTISTPVTIAHRPPPPPPPPEPASEPPRPPSISGARATTTTSTTTTTTATASSSSSQSSSPAQGGGGGGWKIFRSPFSSAKPKQAFLGYENRYVFDRERQMWVLEDELAPLQQQPQPPPQPQQPTQAPQPHPSTHYQASSSSHEAPLARPSSPAPPLSDDDAASVEEHGLVLAIQAAHYAERFQRQQQHDHADPRLLGSFGDRQRTLMLNQRGGGGAVGSTTIDVAGQYHHPSSSSSEDHQQYRPPPPSCFLVLQSVCLLVCWSALHVSLEAMVPLWLLTPWHAGGVGLSTRTVGVLACLTALLLLAFAMLGPRSLRNLPWTSPLRAFRLSSCLLVLTCLSVIFRPSLPGLLHLTTPFVTVHYLLLLSSLTFSLALGRHASVTLCHMVLKHTVSNPGHVVKSAAAAGQVAGPFVAAFILSWSLQAGLPYPMDSRLIFHAAAILSLALYVLSLTLHINVVGDFGVSGEDDDDAIFGHALASRIWRYIGDAFGLSSYRDFSRVLDDRMQTPRQYHYHHKPK